MTDFGSNFWTELIGFSQIKTDFDPKYERIFTLEGYDRILQYYLRPGGNATDEDSKTYDNEPDYDNNSSNE